VLACGTGSHRGPSGPTTAAPAGGAIIADGLIRTIGSNTAYGLNSADGDQVVSIPSGNYANHFPTPPVGDGLLLLPGDDQVVAFMGPTGLPPPLLTNNKGPLRDGGLLAASRYCET
jgi:hypothetical protein